MLSKFERYKLTFGPTPIEKLSRLTAHLGGDVGTGEATATTLPGGPLTLAVPTCCMCAGGWPIGVASKFDWNRVCDAQAESSAEKMMHRPGRADRNALFRIPMDFVHGVPFCMIASG
jgi:hypothetical protein